jgi:hypothetical protein
METPTRPVDCWDNGDCWLRNNQPNSAQYDLLLFLQQSSITSTAPSSASAPLLQLAAAAPINPMENRPSESCGLHVAPHTNKSTVSPPANRPATTADDGVSHRQSAVMAPNEDLPLHIMKTTTDWLLSCSTKVQWKNLTANTIDECIDSIHREIQSQKAVKIASIIKQQGTPFWNSIQSASSVWDSFRSSTKWIPNAGSTCTEQRLTWQAWHFLCCQLEQPWEEDSVFLLFTTWSLDYLHIIIMCVRCDDDECEQNIISIWCVRLTSFVEIILERFVCSQHYLGYQKNVDLVVRNICEARCWVQSKRFMASKNTTSTVLVPGT